MDWTRLYYSPMATGKFPPVGWSRFLGLHAGLMEGFDGGEELCSDGRVVDGAVLFDLTTTTSILLVRGYVHSTCKVQFVKTDLPR